MSGIDAILCLDVLADGRMAAARAASGVNGDTFMVVEDFDHAMCQSDIDLFTNQTVGHAIKAVQDINVVTGMPSP